MHFSIYICIYQFQNTYMSLMTINKKSHSFRRNIWLFTMRHTEDSYNIMYNFPHMLSIIWNTLNTKHTANKTPWKQTYFLNNYICFYKSWIPLKSGQMMLNYQMAWMGRLTLFSQKQYSRREQMNSVNWVGINPCAAAGRQAKPGIRGIKMARSGT